MTGRRSMFRISLIAVVVLAAYCAAECSGPEDCRPDECCVVVPNKKVTLEGNIRESTSQRIDSDTLPTIHPPLDQAQRLARLRGKIWRNHDPKLPPTPPGYDSLKVLSDRTDDFLEDPIGFVTKMSLKHNSCIFVTRLCLRSTVITYSNMAAQAFLKVSKQDTEIGFSNILIKLLGRKCMLFPSEDEDDSSKQTSSHKLERFKKALTPEFLESFEERFNTDFIAPWCNSLTPNKPQDLYSMIKSMSTELMWWFFTGTLRQQDSELFAELDQASSRIFKGLTAIITDFKSPVIKSEPFNNGVSAKTTIGTTLYPYITSSETGSAMPLLRILCSSEEETKSQIAFLTSSLVSKVIASVVTSLIITSNIWRPGIEDPEWGDFQGENMEPVILEVLRLYPPLMATYKVTSTNTTEMGGYRVLKDQAVMIFNWLAHRDPEVFAEPEKFDVQRWLPGNEHAREKIFFLGDSELSQALFPVFQLLIKVVIQGFGRMFRWEMSALDAKCKWKLYPTLRPKEPVMVTLRKLPQRPKFRST